MIRKSLAYLAVAALAAGQQAQPQSREQGGPLPEPAREEIGSVASRSAPATDQPGETVTGQHGLTLELPPGLSPAMLGERDVEALAVQVMLDRTKHSPGVIDGYGGGNTDRAIKAYRRDAGLGGYGGESAAIDAELLRSLLQSQGGDIFRTYVISREDVDGPFFNVPSSIAGKAELAQLGYETPREMLAERFHMDQELLAALNPGVDFGTAGTRIVVVSRGRAGIAGEVARIEVRKGANAVVALAGDGTVLATYPATIGSPQFPSPAGMMEVVAVAPAPNYTFDNSQHQWGPQESFVIAPGPNNPVGGTWIDLSKDGYGIHGSPDPQLIGKTASHGCVRLTNWDAEELAAAVTRGVEVVFVEDRQPRAIPEISPAALR